MVSMKEIADEAGVSQSTVSLILGNHPLANRLSEATRERVLQIVKERGYRKNALVRSLVSGASKIIGFGAWMPSAWHSSTALDGAMTRLETEGYFTKSFPFHGIEERTAQVIDHMFQYRVAGIICMNPPLLAARILKRECRQTPTPIVYIDGDARRGYAPRVFSDDALGCQLAVTHAHELGHRRFGFVGASRRKRPYRFRRQMYAEALQAHGLSLPPSAVFSHEGLDRPDHIDAFTGAVVEKWLRMRSRPTVLLCAGDVFAATLLRHLANAGIKVPTEVSVVGYSDNPIAELVNPPLTTVRQDFFGIGNAAVELLLQQLEGNGNGEPGGAKELLTPVELVVRHSTGPVPTGSE